MSAIKNLFSDVGNLFKSGKSEAKAVKTTIKSADSKVLKTTSKTLGSSAKEISGGQSVMKSTASNFVKGAGSTARIGGKVIAGTGLFAIPAAAGLYGYDKFKNVLARNSDYYTSADDNKNYAAETENLKDRITVLSDAQKAGIDGNNGVNGVDYLQGGSTSGSDSATTDNTKYYILGGAVLLLVGAFIYSKNLKGGKKK